MDEWNRPTPIVFSDEKVEARLLSLVLLSGNPTQHVTSRLDTFKKLNDNPVNIFHRANVGERQFFQQQKCWQDDGVQCWPRVECTKITFSANTDKLRFASVWPTLKFQTL